VPKLLLGHGIGLEALLPVYSHDGNSSFEAVVFPIRAKIRRKK
jgi:hypothetical protein